MLVDVARSAEERRRGLRGRSPLEPGEGLLIAFPVEDEVCIVNEGVSFAIDAVFVGEGGMVSAVESFASGEGPERCHLARTVLELPSRGEVMPGDHVRYRGVGRLP